MKQKINFIGKAILLIMLIIPTYCIGQTWVNATVSNITYSGSPSSYGALYVSNSVDRTVKTAGGVPYTEYFSATAWDSDNGAYIGWAYDDGYGHLFDGVITIAGHISQAHTLHPDVIVIKRASGIFYIVTASYNSGGSGGVYADMYELTVTSNLPSAPTLSWASPAYAVLSSANLPSSSIVNLDISQGDKLVAVWTESVSGTLQVKAKTAKFISNVITWSSNTFTFPSFTYNSTTYTAPFRDADVAVFEKANGDNIATFCMIKAESNYLDKLIISEDIAFADLEAGTTFTSLSAAKELDYAGTTLAEPRIDRQRQLDTYDQTGWTVVFVKYNMSTYVADICGITFFL